MTDRSMTRPDLDAIQARVEAATPGPWAHLTAPSLDDPSTPAQWMADTLVGGDRLHVVTAASTSREYAYVVPAVTGDGPTSEANAAFVAHAREDIPALLAALAAEGARADQAEQRIAAMQEHGGWSCLHCGHAAEAHSLHGHLSFQCVWEPYWKSAAPTAEQGADL